VASLINFVPLFFARKWETTIYPNVLCAKPPSIQQKSSSTQRFSFRFVPAAEALPPKNRRQKSYWTVWQTGWFADVSEDCFLTFWGGVPGKTGCQKLFFSAACRNT